MSECMAQTRKNPHSSFRRASSTILEVDEPNSGGFTVSGSMDTETGDLLKLAKINIQKLKDKGKKVS